MSLPQNIVMYLNNVMPQNHHQNETRTKKDAPTVQRRGSSGHNSLVVVALGRRGL